MIFKGQLTDKKPLIITLQRETGETAVYSGPPKFQHVVGKYTVLKDGSLLIADNAASDPILERLMRAALIERPLQDGRLVYYGSMADIVPSGGGIFLARKGIVVPFAPGESISTTCQPGRDIAITPEKTLISPGKMPVSPGEMPVSPEKVLISPGRAMTNLVNALASKGALINKAVGDPYAIRISKKLVDALKESNPSTAAEFFDAVFDSGGEKTMRGLCFTSGYAFFTTLPNTEPCRTLAESIVASAQSSVWIKAVPPTVTNEKYTFRVWMNSMGMIGDMYKTARTELLANLDGDSAFRTEDQRATFNRRRRAKAEEDSFVLL